MSNQGTDSLRYCPKCKRNRLVGCFHYHKCGDRHRYGPYCKECTVIAVREWRQKNRNKYRISRRKMKYGITEADYQEILDSQSGGCAICGAATSGNAQIPNLAVDHCHTSGRVRGLLCHNCNVGVGAFRDDPELMAKAAEYVKRNLSNIDPLENEDVETLAAELGIDVA